MIILKMDVNEKKLYTGDGKHFVTDRAACKSGFTSVIEAKKAERRLKKMFSVLPDIVTFGDFTVEKM